MTVVSPRRARWRGPRWRSVAGSWADRRQVHRPRPPLGPCWATRRSRWPRISSGCSVTAPLRTRMPVCWAAAASATPRMRAPAPAVPATAAGPVCCSATAVAGSPAVPAGTQASSVGAGTAAPASADSTAEQEAREAAVVCCGAMAAQVARVVTRPVRAAPAAVAATAATRAGCGRPAAAAVREATASPPQRMASPAVRAARAVTVARPASCSAPAVPVAAAGTVPPAVRERPAPAGATAIRASSSTMATGPVVVRTEHRAATVLVVATAATAAVAAARATVEPGRTAPPLTPMRAAVGTAGIRAPRVWQARAVLPAPVWVGSAARTERRVPAAPRAVTAAPAVSASRR